MFEVVRANTFDTERVLEPFMWMTDPSPKDILWFVVPSLSVCAEALREVHPEATCVVVVTKPVRNVSVPSHVTCIHFYTDGTPEREIDLASSIDKILHSRPRVSWKYMKSQLEILMSPWHVAIVGPQSGYVGFERLTHQDPAVINVN